MIIIGAQYDVDLDQSAGGGESEKDLSWIYSEYRVDRSSRWTGGVDGKDMWKIVPSSLAWGLEGGSCLHLRWEGYCYGRFLRRWLLFQFYVLDVH